MNPLFRRLYVLLFLFSSAIFHPQTGFAHNAQPCYLEIQELPGGGVHIIWKNLITDKEGTTLTPIIGKIRLDSATEKESISENYIVQEWTIQLPDSIIGQPIFIEGLEQSSLAVLIRMVYRDGSVTTSVLSASRPSFTPVKDHLQPAYRISAYLKLGIEHILTGFDHLLFVLGLLLLVKNRRSLLKTITAFTIAHSITLALSALHLVQLPPLPVEAIIALSIVFLALEIIRHYEGIHRLSYRYPWLVAFLFGLLHGFGFAGALSEVGLPESGNASALLLFNAGVETGQLLFVAALLLLGYSFRRPISKAPLWMKKVPPYAIGSLAAFWFIERLLAFLN